MTTSIYESLQGHDPREWAYLWLVRLNVPRSLSNMKVVYSWMFWESGGGGGMFNPLNTVQPWPGATDYNSIGVKNYLTWEDGQAANQTAVLQPRFSTIMKELRNGQDTNGLIDAITSSEWGTTILRLRTLPLPPKENDMLIQPGRTSTVPGKVPYAIPAIDGQHVELWYGARMVNDFSTADPNLFLWHPVKLASSSMIVGMTARIVGDPSSGGETRPGPVVADNAGGVHGGYWK
jgi:hypothetical protein